MKRMPTIKLPSAIDLRVAKSDDQQINAAVTRMVQAARMWFASHPASTITRISKTEDRELNETMETAASAELESRSDHDRTIARLRALGILAAAEYRQMKVANSNQQQDAGF